MVMPFVAQDLGHIMKRRRLTDRIITYLFYQLLRGLKDLKPGNLAVNENCELKCQRHRTPKELNSYRPVALTSHLMKTLERLGPRPSAPADGDDREYRGLIQDFADWCLRNNLQINAGKTKELVVDFRRRSHSPPAPVSIQGMNIDTVKSYKYLGVYLNDSLDWTHNTDALDTLTALGSSFSNDVGGKQVVTNAWVTPAHCKVEEIVETFEKAYSQILDFGLARQTESEMTGYVVTRWYRAPEVIFNWMHYSQTVDVWSAACILAEMITGQVLFPGHDSIDQLKKIIRLTGTPDSSLLQKMQSKDAQTYMQSLPPQKKGNFKELFPSMDKNAVDLLEGMLLLDPETRLTAKQGLTHALLAEYHDPESEPESKPYDDSFESLELAVGEWKSLIHMEIMTFDPDNPSRTAM
ncbi:hypothetical protein L3Q82_015661 [Scortum barcoo]|uniref:Uncharacterized protein n=1 Tax=Scortum barcoo TaxID=214431 RepID=A0ACB8VNZ0_9TELE|nr:hypothetical protein L3Q82_015661 [Scortum barcoo]